MRKRIMQRFDRDGNGQLSPQERKKLRKAIQQRMGKKRGFDDRGHGRFENHDDKFDDRGSGDDGFEDW